MAQILRNFLYFLKRKLFLYFKKWKPRTFFLYFRKWNFLIFRETSSILENNFRGSKNKKTHSEKTSYISGNGTL